MASEVGDAIRRLYATDPDRDVYEGLAAQVDDLWERNLAFLATRPATVHQVQTYTDSRELQAIEVIEHALFGMLHTDVQRRRVLNYTLDALDERMKERP